MLGFSTHVLNAGDRLLVAVPADLVLTIIFALPLLLWIKIYRMSDTPRGRRNSIVFFVVNLFIVSFIFTPARVELDAKNGTATINTLMFFIPRHRVIPLASVQGARVKTSELTQALTLVLTDGQALQLTPFDQIRGNDTAAAAINAFLREHGGAGQPY